MACCPDCRAKDLKALGSFPGVMQIVPTADDVELLTNPAGPQQGLGSGDLINHGGRTLTYPKIFNIYLGSMTFGLPDFDAFSKGMAEQGYYVGPDGKMPAGKFMGSHQIAPNPLPLQVTDFQIGGTLDNWLRQALPWLPADDGQTIYSFIFPVGTVISLGSDKSCSSFCGFHEKSAGGHLYQVIVDGTCVGCHGSFSVNDSRMMIQAHEWSESISDPEGQTWYDIKGYENADKCAWQRVSWGLGWAVQPQWVNGRGCVVGTYAPASPPPVPVPVPNPPPPVPPPVPEPVPTVVFTAVAFDSSKSYTFPAYTLPAGAGAIRSLYGRFTEGSKSQPFAVNFSIPRTPVGKALRWLAGKL